MKKRLTIYGVLAVVIYAGFLSYCYFSDGVTKENYRRIKKEMTKSEIANMLGAPLRKPIYSQDLPLGGVIETWRGREGTIVLTFDAADHIVWKEWDDRRQRSLLDDLLGVPDIRE